MKGQPKISSVYSLGDKAHHDPEIAFAKTWKFARTLWMKCGICVMWPNSLPPELKKQVTDWANDEYGRSKHGR